MATHTDMPRNHYATKVPMSAPKGTAPAPQAGPPSAHQVHADNRHTQQDGTHTRTLHGHKKQVDRHTQEKSLPVCPAGCHRLIQSSRGTHSTAVWVGALLCTTSLDASSSLTSPLDLSPAHDPFCCGLELLNSFAFLVGYMILERVLCVSDSLGLRMASGVQPEINV